MPGPCLSTLLPVMGPATAQFPALSQTLRLSVGASESSVPAATSVESEKLASPGLARPEPPSLAVQAMPTSAACQAASGKMAASLPVRHLRAEVVFVGDANGARAALGNLEAAGKSPGNEETVFEAEHSCTGALARMHHQIFRSIDEYLIHS